MEALQAQAGVRLTAVHYRGAAPAMTDVIAGHIQLMFVSFGSALQSWKAGNLKMLGIGSPKRLPDYPDLPTVAEGGLPGFEAQSWFGLFATGGTPRDDRRQDQRRRPPRSSKRTDFRKTFLAQQMMQSITSTPEAYAELIRTDSRRWSEGDRAPPG